MAEAAVTRRVLVCGGRYYRRADRVNLTLDALHAAEPIAVIVHGCAPGADMLAQQWAARAGVGAMGFRAHWDTDGHAAGPIRNARMLKDAAPDLVVAFPGGRGTEDMVRRARAAGVPVLEVA
jgi:hypothetical protein